MTLDRLARLTLTASLAFGVAACAIVEDPNVRGTCELVVRTWDVFHYVPLEPPYQTTMYRRPSGVEEANLSPSGTGWGMTQVSFTGPGKSVSGNIDMTEEGQKSDWFATAPGTWHFRLTSGPCTRVFDVEVKPVP